MKLPEYIKEDLDMLLEDLDADTLEIEYFSVNSNTINTLKVCGFMIEQDEYEYSAYYHWVCGVMHKISENLYSNMRKQAWIEDGSKLYGSYYEKEDCYNE